MHFFNKPISLQPSLKCQYDRGDHFYVLNRNYRTQLREFQENDLLAHAKSTGSLPCTYFVLFWVFCEIVGLILNVLTSISKQVNDEEYSKID